MRISAFYLLLLAAGIVAGVHARQEGVCFTVVFYPPPSPTASNSAAAAAAAHKPPATHMNAATRRQIAERARQSEELEERFARQLFLRTIARQPPVDPEKDDYRKYLQEKQRKEEAANDPDVAEVRARYRADDRDEFRKWKESQPPKPEKAGGPQPKELDLRALLDGVGAREKAPPRKRGPEEE